ncbi:DNA internalization-related competence protein ComEC/Rec2 [Salinibacter grassmerensis]|uniref:DNA internalization-related competence protein ComEC/Rec2 n=1 Tax=Salinibacter grassmerensis TaxID=3040353 RepID=UPI0021E792E2|nr:DNA internalization-related competence protein ComEC/Rec2 [Salinibacter grassmerensis]
MDPDSSVHWGAYPAVYVAVAFTLGVLGGSMFESAVFSVWLSGAGGGVVLFAGAQWWDRSRLVTLAPLGRVLAIAVVVGCAGGARYSIYQASSPRGLAPAAGAGDDDVTLQGTITDAPEQTNEATRFVLTVDSLFGARGTAAVEGRVRVTLKPSPWADRPPSFPELHQGDVTRLRGALRRPPGLRNPGGFDYAGYLSRRGICCTLYVDAPDHVDVLGNQRGVVQSALVSVRAHIRHQVDRYIPSAGGRAVLSALLLGDRSRITDAQRDRFAKTGLMHLLAVSGLHVFLVGMVLYTLLRPLLLRFRTGWRAAEVIRAVLTVAVLILYMLLTGGRPSVVRAVIMATLFIGSIFFQRSTHPLNTLGVAALILLAVRPPMLFDVGFQLSMVAVSGIVTLNPRFLEMVPDRYRTSEALDWALSTATASAAAILGTAPVLLYHFGWVSVAGLLLNMVGIPCTGLALTSAIATVAVGGVWTTAAASFGSAADLFLRGLLATSKYGAAWGSWAGIRMPTPSVWELLALGAGLIAVAQWPRPRLRWRWIIVGGFFMVGSVWGPVVGSGSAPTLDVVFFDVGQGDAVLLKTSSDHHILIDTGPRSPSGAAAEYVVLPFLKRWGIRRLDLVVISHSDEDHLGGLPALLRAVKVSRLAHNGRSADTELYDETRRLLRQKSITHQPVERRDTLQVGPSIRVKVLSPPEQSSFQTENNASVVLEVAYGDVNVLLPGDIEKAAERNLVRTYGEKLEGNVVKVPHHGSETSSHPAFVDSATDSTQTHAVVSVAQNQQYEMPNANVIRRWKVHGNRLHSTATSGAVWIKANGKATRRWQWR